MSLSRHLRITLATIATAVVGISLLSIAPPAGSQVLPTLLLTPTGGVIVQGSTASITGTLSQPCDAIPEATAITVTVGGTPLASSAITVVDASSFVVTVPGGLVPLEADPQLPVVAASITCPIATTAQTLEAGIEMAEIVVTKSVSGTAPTGALFGIDVSCIGEIQDSMVPTWTDGAAPAALADPMTMAMDLAAGESSSVFTFSPQTCVFTEPDPLGATVTIAPDTVETVTPSGFRVLVTNTYGSGPKFTG